MRDYQWKSTEPVVTPPRPKLLLSDWQLIVFWALTSAIGLAASFFIAIGLTGGAPNETIIVGSLVSAILIGWMEMLLLRLQRVRVKWWWIVNTAIAFLTWGAAYPIFRSVGLWSGLGLGVLLGMFQYINLRTKVEHGSYWVAANVIGWTIGLALFPLLVGIVDWMLAWAVCGLVGGAISGLVMSRLVHEPIWEYAETPLKDDYQS